MDFQENEKGLTLVANRKDRQELGRLHKELGETFHSDNTMVDWLHTFIDLSEFGWTLPEEIGALTAAPILTRRDDHYNIVDAFGFMDYCLHSVLQDLQETGKAFFQRG